MQVQVSATKETEARLATGQVFVFMRACSPVVERAGGGMGCVGRGGGSNGEGAEDKSTIWRGVMWGCLGVWGWW